MAELFHGTISNAMIAWRGRKKWNQEILIQKISDLWDRKSSKSVSADKMGPMQPIKHRGTAEHLLLIWWDQPLWSPRQVKKRLFNSGRVPSKILQVSSVFTHKVVPHSLLSWFITPITMVYGTYNYSIHGVYKPTNITGGHHPASAHL